MSLRTKRHEGPATRLKLSLSTGVGNLLSCVFPQMRAYSSDG